MKNKGCLIAVIISIVLAVFIVARIVLLFIGTEEKPPVITESEFPFVVEYELNGERHIIEDVVICKFAGYDLSSITYHKPRTWGESLKSKNEEKRIIVRFEDNTESLITKGRINIESKIRLNYGSADYYMGDPTSKSLVHKGMPRIEYAEYFQRKPNEYEHKNTILSEEQLEQIFGIKIIRFEFSKPIENTFE